MAKEGLMDRLKKSSTIKTTAVLKDSKFFTQTDLIHIDIPALDILLSGDIDGGFVPGITTWAGASKSFKTMFSLIMAKKYMDKYPDSILMYYDNEFGTPIDYFNSLEIDTNRVLHSPILNLEELKFDLVKQLNDLERGDKVIIVVDSIGNIASKKEVEDALDEKSVADMTRAKQIKSLFRMITPYMRIKNIPCVIIAHIYQTQELYSKAVVSGGTGPYYASDSIFIVGRQQEKDGTELIGHNFVVNVEKSRFVREKSKIPITVKFDGGVSKYTGLIELALESGIVIKPSNGWYSRVFETGEIEAKKWRLKDTDCAEFWEPVLKNENFRTWIVDNFKVSNANLFGGGVSSPETEIEDDEIGDD